MPTAAAVAATSAHAAQTEARHVLAGRALFDRLESALAASRLPARRALSAAAALGRLRGTLSGRWPAVSDVATLFGTGRVASRKIALRIVAHEARNRLVLRRGAGRSLAPFAPLVGWRDEGGMVALQAPLGPPVVLLTAHIGALHLLAVGLDRLAVRRTVLRWSPHHLPHADEDNAPIRGGMVARTAALRQALERLREGGMVVTALEGAHGSTVPGELFGRAFDLGGGGFALARLAGARIVPVAALWEGNRVVLEHGAADRERIETPVEAVRWFEALLRRAPEQIGLAVLRRLLCGPPLAPVAPVAPAVQSAGEDTVRR